MPTKHGLSDEEERLRRNPLTLEEPQSSRIVFVTSMPAGIVGTQHLRVFFGPSRWNLIACLGHSRLEPLDIATVHSDNQELSACTFSALITGFVVGHLPVIRKTAPCFEILIDK